MVVVFVIYTNLAAIAVRLYFVPRSFGGFCLVAARRSARPLSGSAAKEAQNRRCLGPDVDLLVGAFGFFLSCERPDGGSHAHRTYVLEGIALYLLMTNVIRDLPALRRTIW